MPLERISADDRMPRWIRYEHETRYRWAGPQVRGRRVIDAACGTGYGTKVLAECGATSVDGFDVSQEAVRTAELVSAAPGTRFEVADVTSLPVADRDYDVFVSFETIEHVEDDRGYLDEVVRVLRPEGIFLCSTPNRDVTNPGTTLADTPFNPHHVREYSRAELASLLGEYFSEVTLLGQTPRRGSYVHLLNRIGRVSPMLALRAHQVRKLLGLPWERPERHRPLDWPVRGAHEVLLAVCSGPRAT